MIKILATKELQHTHTLIFGFATFRASHEITNELEQKARDITLFESESVYELHVLFA